MSEQYDEFWKTKTTTGRRAMAKRAMKRFEKAVLARERKDPDQMNDPEAEYQAAKRDLNNYLQHID